MKVFFAGHLWTHQKCTAEKNPINATSALQCGDCGGDFGDSVFDDSSKVVILRILRILANMLILANLVILLNLMILVYLVIMVNLAILVNIVILVKLEWF